MKVLVLEKHTERGGQTHTFRRDGASWDVGLHYVGEMQEGRSSAGCSISCPVARCAGTGCRTTSSASSIRASISRCHPIRGATRRGWSTRFPDEAGGHPSLFSRSARGRALARPRHPGADDAGAARVSAGDSIAASALPGRRRPRATICERHFRSPELKACSPRNGATMACRRARAPSPFMPSSTGSYLMAAGFPRAVPGVLRARSNQASKRAAARSGWARRRPK